jgi:hypothetical protein
MLSGKHIVRVQAAYSTFWEKITKLTSGKAKRLDRQKLSVNLDDRKRIIVDTGALEIGGASSRPSKHHSKQRFNIFLQSQCTIEGTGDSRDPTLVLRQCVVRVLWLEEVAADKKPRSVRGLHFDYAEDDHHPIFHVQVDDRVLTPAFIGVDYECDATRVETPRIPTAPIDLCAAVYMILHDHFSPLILQGWSVDTQRAIAGIPRLPCKPITDRVKEHSVLDCVWWYPNHQKGYQGQKRDDVT